jgi:hypothetical protein
MDLQQQTPLTASYAKAALVAGTTSTVTTTVTAMYTINGKMYTKTAITNGATPTTDAATGVAFVPITFPNNGCVFVWGLDASGNQKVVQGPIQALDSSGNFIVAPQFGPVPDTMCPLAYIVIKLGATAVANWTFGTNNLSGVTGVTYTFVDIGTLPGRPQVS